jgi:hypothetical protein
MSQHDFVGMSAEELAREATRLTGESEEAIVASAVARADLEWRLGEPIPEGEDLAHLLHALVGMQTEMWVTLEATAKRQQELSDLWAALCYTLVTEGGVD